MAGWVRLRGTLQVRPCKLGRAIHGAHAPATGPTPPSTDLRDLSEWPGLLLVGVDLGRHVDPRHAWMLFVQLSKYSISMEFHPRMTGIQQTPGRCQGWGGMGRQDRWRHGWRHRAPMDGFTACPACPCRPAHLGSRFRCCFGSGLCGCRAAARPAPRHFGLHIGGAFRCDNAVRGDAQWAWT